MLRIRCVMTGLLVCAGLGAFPVVAQIKIGQTAGHSGAVAASVKETTSGAQLYFDAVNAKGGGKPVDSNKITSWFKMEKPIKLSGVVKELA